MREGTSLRFDCGRRSFVDTGRNVMLCEGRSSVNVDGIVSDNIQYIWRGTRSHEELARTPLRYPLPLTLKDCIQCRCHQSHHSAATSDRGLHRNRMRWVLSRLCVSAWSFPRASSRPCRNAHQLQRVVQLEGSRFHSSGSNNGDSSRAEGDASSPSGEPRNSKTIS